MKLKITLAFILLASAFSCKKEANSDALTGKWRTTEILLTPATNQPLYIQFSWPDKAQSTFFPNCTGYSLNGNNLTLKNTGIAATQVTYTYTIKQDTLTLYPTNSSDCSGCSFPFVKE